jgi:membrane protein required for colicin V production
MAWFDLVALIVIAVSAFQGAWRGMASQLAPIASLVVGYLVAIPMSKDLAPWFGTEAPGNRFLAALVMYVAISFAVHMVTGFFRETLAQLRLASFDNHLGFLLGGAKGLVICMLMSFFGIGLSEKSRETILATRTGKLSASVMRQIEPLLPSEVRDLLDGSFEAIANSNNLLPIAPPRSPSRRSIDNERDSRRFPDEYNENRWASDWGSEESATSNRSRIETPPRRPSAFLKEAARVIEDYENRR